MLRTLLRIVLLLIIVAAVAAFFVGYRMAGSEEASEPSYAVGTAGRPVDVGSARKAGADIAEKVADGANQAQRVAANAALTAKIKSKMALDDTVEAARIDVDTAQGVVTLNGTVESPAQRERAVQLARETDGVTSVIDRLTIR
jgi:BON domain-containing protein